MELVIRLMWVRIKFDQWNKAPRQIEVLVQFATLAEGAAKVASLIANGIPYTEWVE